MIEQENSIFLLVPLFNMLVDFNRYLFFPKKKSLIIKDIIIHLGSIIKNKSLNFDLILNDISSSKNPKNNSIIFFNEYQNLNFDNYKKSLFITSNQETYNSLKNFNKIFVKNLDDSYTKIINNFISHDDDLSYKDEFELINNSYISKYSNIHNSSNIANNCVIGRGVKIGKNCIIKNNVILKNSIVGDNVIICDNSTIGCSGFGFNLKNLGSKNIIPQIGIVYIEDNVHIGSNCTIDRGRIDNTYLGKNSVIDNMVHIAHNVSIGCNACIAAQTGISGSTVIGDNFISGGQSGFAGHLIIGDNVIVAAKSGVTKNIQSKSTVAGFPATDINQWKKQIIKNRKNGYK